MNEYFAHCRANDHPPALPPNREIKMIHTTTKVDTVCNTCRRKPGTLTCSRCCAVNFCSPECQKKMWKQHRSSCNKVKKLVEETEALIADVLSSHGGEEGFLKSEKVKKGLHDWVPLGWIDRGLHVAKDIVEKYLMKREWLMLSYADIGKDSLSKTAYRLAAENALDLLCLTYHNARGEECHKAIGSWMVAGGMDQEAINYIVYLNKRRSCKTKKRLPYLDIESEDVDLGDEDSIIEAILTEDRQEPSTYSWFHYIMLFALLRIKRHQRRFMEMHVATAKWKSFLMGTHPVIGKDSPVKLLRGNSLVLAKIEGLVVPYYSKPRPTTIELHGKYYKVMEDEMLHEPQKIGVNFDFVQKRNQHLIPGLLNPSSIPGKPFRTIFDIHLLDWENDLHCEDPQTARHAVENYGPAYKMSPVYHMMLDNFMKTGKITEKNKPIKYPVGGFYQTAIDADPTKAFGDCSAFSLICLKSKTSVHTCA